MMQRYRSVVLGFVCMLLSTSLFAIAGPVAKALYSIGWTPGSVVTARMAGAALILLVPTLIALRGRWHQVRLHSKGIALYGIVAMAGEQACFFLALQHLSVALAILMEIMGAPLITVFWLWARAGQRPGIITGIGILVSLVGVILVLDLRGSSVSWIGLLLALGAAACFASYFLIASDRDTTLPPIAFTGLAMSIGAIAVALAAISQIMPARFVATSLDLVGFKVSWLVPTLLLIVFTAAAYLFGIVGLRHLGATVGSFVNLTEVPFSAIAAWLLLAETLTTIQLIGGAVIICDIVLVKWGEQHR